MPTLETLDFTIRIGSTPTFLHFGLYLNTAYAAHYVYFNINVILSNLTILLLSVAANTATIFFTLLIIV